MASVYDGATVEILNWDEYQPRKDIKLSIWFRLQNSFFEDPNFFHFNHSELLFWIYLLSMASKKMNGSIRFSFMHANRVGRFSKEDVESAFQKLEELQCVRVAIPEANAHVTHTLRIRHADVTLQDKTRQTRQTNKEKGEQNFDERERVTVAQVEPDKPPQENAAAKAPAPVHEFIAAYCENFKAKFGSNPPIVGQDAGIAKRMVKDLGLERAKALVGAYFSMSNAFYQERKYDLATFESNLKAIAVKYDTGQSFNRAQGRQQEIRDANVDAARAYLAAKGAS